MPGTFYPPETKVKAVQLALEEGADVAVAYCGANEKTIRRWAEAQGQGDAWRERYNPRSDARTYPEAVRIEAVRLWIDESMDAAIEHSGASQKTILTWAKQQGLRPAAEESERRRHERDVDKSVAKIQKRQLQLAEDLLDDIAEMRRRFRAPLEERRAFVVSNPGPSAGSDVQVVDIRHETPPTGDVYAMVKGAAILVDRVLKITAKFEAARAADEPKIEEGGEDELRGEEAREVVERAFRLVVGDTAAAAGA